MGLTRASKRHPQSVASGFSRTLAGSRAVKPEAESWKLEADYRQVRLKPDITPWDLLRYAIQVFVPSEVDLAPGERRRRVETVRQPVGREDLE